MLLPKVKKYQGFTLIELIIVVAIIGIITIATVPSFTNYVNTQYIKQAQEQLRSDMRTVQNRALSGTLSDQPVGGAPMKYWGILFTQNSNSYTFFISSIDNQCPPTLLSQGKGMLKSDITVTNLTTASACLFFSVSNGNITSSGGINSPITVGNAVTTRNVTFNQYGLIF